MNGLGGMLNRMVKRLHHVYGWVGGDTIQSRSLPLVGRVLSKQGHQLI